MMSIDGLSVPRRLADASLEIHEGEMLGLIGPNGAGKSTLLNAIAGLLPGSGRIALRGEALERIPSLQKARQIALQPQFIESVWALSVHDIVSMGRLPWGDSDHDIIRAAMQQAKVTEFAGRHVNELSGGERARVWLARVLANRPVLMLVDEPVANLDIHYQQEVMRILRDYARAGQAVVIAIHDLSLAARYCDRLCLMDDGRVVKTDSIGAVLNDATLSPVFRVAVHVDLDNSPPVVLAR
jgi:iron complex transport system ATP-binding protein